MSEYQQLAERLARLETERDIASLMARYARLVDDHADADAIAALFTDGAVYETFGDLGADPAAAGPIVGRSAILETFRLLPEMLSFTTHYLCNPDISVAEDAQTAHGRWQVLELANVEASTGRVPLVLVAEYRNDFVRRPDGWRIERIRFGDRRTFPYLTGFAHTKYTSMHDLHSIED